MVDPTIGERGPHGDHGQSGDIGATGIRGETGRDGLAGLAGLPGERGKTGDQGQAGEVGATGTTGAQGPPVLTRLQIIVMFLFVVLAFAAVAYRTEAVLNQTREQNDDIQQVLEVTRNAAVGHRDAARELIDCNTPGGVCFKEQQKQVQMLEARIAASRQRTVVAAFVCNDRPGGQQIKTLTVCIEDLLGRK